MDGLSAAASVIAVLQLTGTVIGYLNDVQDAPKACQQCTIEASNLQSLLINLRYRLEQGQASDPWFTAVQALNIENGPLDQYKQALEQLRSKVEIQDGVQRVKRRLLWKFSKEEVTSLLSRIERLKSLVNIALEMDHFKLSLAIKEDISFARDALPVLQMDVVAIRKVQNLQWDAQKLQQHETMVEWLSPTDFPAQQHDIITRRQEGTGQWFLDSPEFKRWLQGSDKTLFCHGIPGAGKTMIAAIAINNLYGMAGCNNIGVAYLFCSYKAQAGQSAASLVAALLKQLVQGRPDIAAPVMHIHDRHSRQKSRPSLNEILEALQSVCSDYTTVYIVVDALDECADRNGTRDQLIDELRKLQARRDVRLLYTSRVIPEITLKFQSDPMLKMRAREEDVKMYIAGQVPRLPNCIRRDQELKQAVQDKIVEAVGDMFLLARLHVDSLLDKRTKQKVLFTLNKLSKGSAALDEAYSEAIKRIDGQLAEDRSLARRALSWITLAQRSLTTKELCHALAIEPGDIALNKNNVYDVEDVISVCAGLITVDDKSSIIRLVHYTTQKYFERELSKWNPSAGEEIAVVCLTYLSFDTFRSGSCASDETFKQRLAENPFFDYSAHYWSEHVRPVEKPTSHLALAFLYDEMLVDCTIQGVLTRSDRHKGYSERFGGRTNGLHLTARCGLLYLTERLLVGRDGADSIGADSKDEDGRTPLLLASANGHEAIVKLLLETGKVDVNSKANDGRTPLSLAAAHGHETVVRLLLETGEANVDSSDGDSLEGGRTPLSLAAEHGHEAVVKLLLETGKVDVNSKANDGRTPLSLASANGHEAIVKLLLEMGKADVNLRRYGGYTPLSLAAAHGHETVVRLLLETGEANVDSSDGDSFEGGRTPLSLAAEHGHEAVVKLLLETGKVDVDSQDDGRYYGGRTPLAFAAAEGNEAVVKLLLETGKVDVNSKADDNRTPLAWAAEDGHGAVVKLLLETGKVDVNSKSASDWTPLSSAVMGGHEVVVRLLVERDDVEVDLRDRDGRTPLSWATANGYEAIVKLLLKTGKVDVNSKANNGWTPLAWAAQNRHEAVVKLLLETGKVDMDSKDSFS